MNLFLSLSAHFTYPIPYLKASKPYNNSIGVNPENGNNY